MADGRWPCPEGEEKQSHIQTLLSALRIVHEGAHSREEQTTEEYSQQLVITPTS